MLANFTYLGSLVGAKNKLHWHSLKYFCWENASKFTAQGTKEPRNQDKDSFVYCHW
jgi:hypothetical protein